MSSVTEKLIVAGFSASVAMGGGLIAANEGLILGTYIDPVGIVTACYGHVDSSLKMGQKFSQEQCLAMLAQDLDRFDRSLRGMVKEPISDYEHAAYLSFIYNVGTGNLKSSTLLKKLNSGDRIGACHELKRWVYARGKKLLGLEYRRQKESEVCLLGVKNALNVQN